MLKHAVMTNDNPTQPIINLRGEKIALGPLLREHLPLWVRWLNDFEATRYLGLTDQIPVTVEAEEEWYRHVSTGKDPHFTIYELPTLRPIGNTGLRDIDHKNGTATYGILIGEKDCWNKGYGTETTRLVLQYAFSVLGLQNVMLTVNAANERGIRAYLKAGFKEMGRRRGTRRAGTEVFDDVYMDCLATDFLPADRRV